MPEPGGPISSMRVPTGKGDLERPPRDGLPADVREIHDRVVVHRRPGVRRRLVQVRDARPAAAATAGAGATATRGRPRPRRRRWRPGSARSRARARPPRPPPPGTTTRWTPAAASAIAIGRIPGTRRTSPPRPSSPISPIRPGPARSCSDPSRMPSAIARSSDAPAFRTSAGARLTVIRRGGWWNPALRRAPRTRSRASDSAASGRPTIVNPGRPGATSTSTRTTRPVIPLRVAESSVASTDGTVAAATHPGLIGPIGRLTRPGSTRDAGCQLRDRGAVGAIDRPREVEHGAPEHASPPCRS